MSPEDIRDFMFETFVGKKLLQHYRSLPASKRKGVKITWRIGLAQAGGMIFYIFALATYLVCVPFFFFNIGWQEWLLRLFPDAESPWEASQWLPWVAVLLTLGAAVVGKHHHTWRVLVEHYVLRHRSPKPEVHPMHTGMAKGYDAVGWVQRHTWRTMERLRLESEALKDFVTDPFYLVLDTTRERTTEHPTVKYSLAGDFPFPSYAERNSHAHYRGPWNEDPSWPSFPVEFFVQADARTLASWERYSRRHTGRHNADLGDDGEDYHIVYDVDLPPVPTYPDKRTVLAVPRDVIAVETKIDPDAPNSGVILTNAITPGARKESTVSFRLQHDPDTAAAAAAGQARPSVSSGKSFTSASAWANSSADVDDTADSIAPVSSNATEAALKKQQSWVVETSASPSRTSSVRAHAQMGTVPTDAAVPAAPIVGPDDAIQKRQKQTDSGVDALAASRPTGAVENIEGAAARVSPPDRTTASSRQAESKSERERQAEASADDEDEKGAGSPLLGRRDADTKPQRKESIGL